MSGIFLGIPYFPQRRHPVLIPVSIICDHLQNHNHKPNRFWFIAILNFLPDKLLNIFLCNKKLAAEKRYQMRFHAQLICSFCRQLN